MKVQEFIDSSLLDSECWPIWLKNIPNDRKKTVIEAALLYVYASPGDEVSGLLISKCMGDFMAEELAGTPEGTAIIKGMIDCACRVQPSFLGGSMQSFFITSKLQDSYDKMRDAYMFKFGLKEDNGQNY